MDTLTIGIDLGTSNSCVATATGGKPTVITDKEGNHIQPSVVSFGNDNKILVGRAAKEQLMKNPKRTVFSIKRLIGRKYFSAEVKKAKQLYPFEIVEDENKEVGIKIGNDFYSPAEISALILKRMKRLAEEACGREVRHAVVTVPAYFNDNQRQATRDACLLAGLEPLRIINEPTAATLAYGHETQSNAKVAVYDLGGGTFDLSILELCDNVFEVIATAGDTYLGGDDFDDRLIDHLAEQFQKKHGLDLRSVPQSLQKLRLFAEQAKIRLSYEEATQIVIPKIYSDSKVSFDLEIPITRQTFTNLTLDLIQRTFKVCDEAFQDAGIKPSELDRIIFVGGSTKMPIIYETCKSYFGVEPYRKINPDEVVAVGAAIQADALIKSKDSPSGEKKKTLLLDVTPLTLSVATVGGFVEPIIPKNTPIPAEQNKLFTTTGDNQDTVRVQIYQGKSRVLTENELLGEFEFSGFRKAPRGEVLIDIRFEIDTDGIVKVSAIDKETGKKQGTKVYLSAGHDDAYLKQVKAKVDKIKEVYLKRQLPETARIEKYLIQLKDNKKFQACVFNFTPESTVINYVEEGDLYAATATTQALDRNFISWMLRVDDFSNIPRHLATFENNSPAFNTQVWIGQDRYFYGVRRPVRGSSIIALGCDPESCDIPLLYLFEGKEMPQQQQPQKTSI